MKRKVRLIITALLIIFLSVNLIFYSDKINKSIINSINLCMEIIIPSTFIFMVISTYITYSGLSKIIFFPFYLLFKRILKMDIKSFSIFLLSLIGGYPIGIKLLKELIAENKNYSEIADKYAMFCFCVSPTYAVTVMGIGIYRSIEAGIIIYLSNIITCFIIAFFCCNFSKLKNTDEKSDESNMHKKGIFDAIYSSSVSLFRMCSIIIFFNAVITIFECCLSEKGIQLPFFLKTIFEISNIIKTDGITPSSLPYVAALTSFGGICVILQCISMINKSFDIKPFIISRVISSLISFIVAKIIITFWDISYPMATYGGNFTFNFNENKSVTIFLLIMCIILIQKKEKNFKKG